MRKLPRSFYNRPTLDVTEEILGKYVVFASPVGRLAARIVEVEAYCGEGDPACHAACGPTERNRLLYGVPGHCYIYFIYGMYCCFNFVTERKGQAAAVLLRAAEPVEGIPIMHRHSPNEKRQELLLSGPGKFCRSFGLTLDQNGADLTGSEVWVEDRGDAVSNIVRAPRIGIRKATEYEWRYFDGDSPSVSRPRPRVAR
jgi:DNA-3-methyladenine glycosylase